MSTPEITKPEIGQWYRFRMHDWNQWLFGEFIEETFITDHNNRNYGPGWLFLIISDHVLSLNGNLIPNTSRYVYYTIPNRDYDTKFFYIEEIDEPPNK